MTLDDIILPNDLIWSDEFQWGKNTLEKGYSVTGSLLLSSGSKKAGRSITLESTEETGWVKKQILLQLQIKSEIRNGEFILTLADGREFNVVFDHSQIALTAQPLFQLTNPSLSHYYKITLKFLEV